MSARQRKRFGSVCVVGEVKVEYRMTADTLPGPAAPARGNSFLESVSGIGGIQAQACSRLGAKVTLFCKLGLDPQADSLKTALAREGIQLAPVPIDRSVRTGVDLVIERGAGGDEAGGETLASGFAGANERFVDSDVFQGAPDLARAGAVIVALGIPSKSISAAIRLAAGSQRPVVVDSGPGAPLEPELLALVDVVCLRKEHAPAWTGQIVEDRETARLAAEQLLWQGARAVIVDAGEDEQLLLQDERELHLPRYALEEGGTGAGELGRDIFPAALGVALAEERSLFEAATFANAAAALAGARGKREHALPGRRDVVELLKRDGIDFDGMAAA